MTVVRLKVPIWLFSVPYYGSILVSLTLCLVLSPLIVVYWLFLCWRISHEWRRAGKDVLIVFADTPSSEQRMEQVLPLVASRSELLNFSERERWDRWSIGPQVFRFYSFFGPEPFLLKSCLPVLFVFRRIYWPTIFSFEGLRTSEAQILSRLRQELGTGERPASNMTI